MYKVEKKNLAVAQSACLGGGGGQLHPYPLESVSWGEVAKKFPKGGGSSPLGPLHNTYGSFDLEWFELIGLAYRRRVIIIVMVFIIFTPSEILSVYFQTCRITSSKS